VKIRRRKVRLISTYYGLLKTNYNLILKEKNRGFPEFLVDSKNSKISNNKKLQFKVHNFFFPEIPENFKTRRGVKKLTQV
jgi:hypothetical protein